MSNLAERKTRLSVEFSDSIWEQGKDRNVTMILSPYILRVRLKGKRTSYEISPARVFKMAALLEAEKRRQARKAHK